MGKSFEDLKVWHRAIDLTVLVYEFTRTLPKEETYGLSAQMRRAAVSVASNIAEGSVRGTRRDFRQFVKLAQGSNSELQTQLIICHRLQYGTEESYRTVRTLSNEVGKMLSALSKYLTKEIKSGATTSN